MTTQAHPRRSSRLAQARGGHGRHALRQQGLHFGHVGGVFVPADFYARFLRDRLGRENVIFVSGTDCYGSPIMEASANAKRPTTTRSTSQTTCARTMTARKPTLPALACLATCTPAARWSPPCTSTSA